MNRYEDYSFNFNSCCTELLTILPTCNVYTGYAIAQSSVG